MLIFLPDNLTKMDLIIFYGGIKDISKNESTKGFHSLKAFVQRTVNTNVMLLEVPHIYDLPSFSCVKTEVKLFNKKLYCLEFIFKHVRSYRFPTGRKHHTNHGLHLNKKGKSWIANNIVKEVKALFLPHRAPLPIALPWKSGYFNMFQPNKGSTKETPSVVGSKNSECQKISRLSNYCNSGMLESGEICSLSRTGEQYRKYRLSREDWYKRCSENFERESQLTRNELYGNTYRRNQLFTGRCSNTQIN
jgi:hypothetical protein